MKTYQYTSTEQTVVAVIDEDGISRMSMLASLVPEGEAILPYVAPAAEAPKVCSPAQGLVALYALKQITEADINTAIAGVPDAVQRYTAQIAFARAIEWRRDSAAMQMLAAMLGLTEQDLDALFAFAVMVEV